MNFELTAEQKEMQKIFRDFAEKEVAPRAQEIDATQEFPLDLVEKMQKLGFMGIPFPEEVGGQGADSLTYALAIEEIAKYCASTAVILSGHVSLGTNSIYMFANDDQMERFVKPLASGKKLGAFALTEHNAGTDAASQEATAVLDGDEYVLNGTKVFITNAGYADIYVVFAMTDKSKGNHGISAFIVEKDTPGFTFGKRDNKMGIHGSSTKELIFENCRIPKANLLGEEGQGFKIAMSTLDGGRIGVASQALGIAEGAFQRTVEYVKNRKQFNKPIASFQNTQFKLADLAVEIESARNLVYKAAVKKDSGERYSVEAAMAKLKASRTAMRVTTEAVQMHGGNGYMFEYEVERMMRDAKITEIYEGTSEVMEMVISSSFLR